MKIHLMLFLVPFTGLILSSGYKRSQVFIKDQLSNDSIQTITIKAKFIKKTANEYCGYVHLPERNMFEIVSLELGVFTKKLIEVEYNTGCLGSNFSQGQTYLIQASKYLDKVFYHNIKTTWIR
jgi:hypothetical protein